MTMLRRDDNRIIIHFDYDCFYASVLEAENPALKSLPLAVQQKQIVVTCNYEARRRGLRKLQLIKEAKQICPEVVIILGEDLTKFRDVSKSLYTFLRAFLWGHRVERLGFDEVFLDVTDMIDHNMGLLNRNDLGHSFFCLDRRDPTQGFEFDATQFCGPTFPMLSTLSTFNNDLDALTLRLILGSYLADHIRTHLDRKRGYTATVGVSTSKLLAKLVGNVNKPNSQTTLTPPYVPGQGDADVSNVTRFIDDHEIGKIPGIGFKTAHKLRTYLLQRELTVQPYNERTQDEQVKVRDVRLSPGMGPPKLLDILGGPGASKDVGVRTWELLNGVDNSEVQEARAVPTQISIEDSFQGIQQFDEVKRQLHVLATSLIRRIRADLVEEDDDGVHRWLAHPRTIRLSTRQRSPMNGDGSREYSYANGRISRSAHAPSFIFSLGENPEAIAEKLVDECLVSMFRKLHPDRPFGELSLINVAVTNMVESAGDQRQSSGRDIGKMFRQQEEVLKDWRLLEETRSDTESQAQQNSASENIPLDDASWEESDEEEEALSTEACGICGGHIPAFALSAHALYHAAPD
ncbi:putative DNA polymerase iota [Talaromyces proteolyticus]|uniref:DNA polymerase iota n=1 Tax=Talaromyces proteolyticus TaxID=1131652 RepID=A0AAD4KS98_9EURO|nr:putative DNA polymerase iota [Talaromyces proteolyticus]KAH8697663.1 putative DNA polymerase iota [Talaromyces proteolyticus]